MLNLSHVSFRSAPKLPYCPIRQEMLWYTITNMQSKTKVLWIYQMDRISILPKNVSK